MKSRSVLVRRWAGLAVLGLALGASALAAQTEPECSQCAKWNEPQTPFQIYGDTYYVGPHGLSVILIASNHGLVLIDGALPESAPAIAEGIKTLGYDVHDVKVILTTHVHMDHAGGIAALQKMSGARVLGSPWSAEVLKTGGVAKDDPQFGDIRGIQPVAKVGTVKDGETVKVGSIAVTAHFTPGHTLGGVSWTWKSCEGDRCYAMVYADSVTAVSREGYKFADQPALLAGFEKSFKFLETVPCDVLMTPHPDASDFWERVDDGHREALSDPGGCKQLAADGRGGLKMRLGDEGGK
jgi:metallo-beta-lactamase class B